MFLKVFIWIIEIKFDIIHYENFCVFVSVYSYTIGMTKIIRYLTICENNYSDIPICIKQLQSQGLLELSNKKHTFQHISAVKEVKPNGEYLYTLLFNIHECTSK